MKALKKYTIWSIAIALAFSVTSCASYSDLPGDDIYYSKKTSNPSEYNWEDFQKNAQSYNTVPVTKNPGNNDEFDYSSSYQANASGDQMSNGEYDYIDEHYDSDYDSRIKRFNDDGNDRDYYDDYYTGGSGCGCGSGSNFSMSFGVGMGFGYGYPYYGYPYYGGYYGSSYWNGYWNGYYDGLYGGGYYPGYGGGYYPGYGGGYYPDYGAPYVAYGPRGSKTGGSTIPKSRGGRTVGGPDDNGSKSGVVGAGRGVAHGNAGATKTVASTASARRAKPIEHRPENTVRLRENQSVASGPKTVASRQDKLKKPETRSAKKPVPRYQKPKSYQSLPLRQPRSSKEYVRPATKPRTTTAKSSANPYTRTRKPAVTTNRSTNTRSTTSGTRSSSYRPSKSYSSPSRSSSSPSRSYSSPTRSSGSSSPSRSSGGGGGSSRSSSSSRGGGHRR